MDKTIIIISHATFDNSPYCSYVHNHAKALAKLGYHVIVLVIVKWIPILSHFQKYKRNFMKRLNRDKVTIDNVDIIYKKTMSISNFFYNSKLNLNGFFAYMALKSKAKKIIERENVVLIDAHTFKVEGYVAKKLKNKYKIPTFVTLHGTSFVKNLTNNNGINQIKQVFNTVDYAICVSDKLKRYLLELGIENSKVIYNGLESYKVKDIDRQKNKILTVANLVKIKNIDLIIEAMKKLLVLYPNIKLFIAGDGIQKQYLEEMVENMKLQSSIQFLGRIENKRVQELMKESFIFILPSVNEGFGIVYPEAMKNGCITIGTKKEGIDGFIIDKENGFLIKPKVDEIVNIIQDIYNEKYNIEKIIENANISVEKLTWENNAKYYIEILKEKEE